MGSIREKDNPVLLYRPRWSLRTPLTLERLSVLYYILVLVVFVAIAYSFAEFRLIMKRYLDQDTSVGYRELFGFLWKVDVPVVVATSLVTVAGWMRMITKKRRQLFSPYPWLPTIIGWEGRISLVKLQSECPICGGELKFYNKQIDWIYGQKTGRKKVLENAPVAECKINPSHWWMVDRSYD